MSQSPNLYRCDFDDKLLLEKHIADGKHVGHRIHYARKGDIWDWLLVQWWKITKQL